MTACVNGGMEHEEAAARAGVVIRELREIGEFEQVYRLFDEIWHPEPANVPVTVELMAGFAHTGNYVAGAFAGDALVGASVGFLASGEALHSHVTGAVIGRGVGYALKLHQRAWCRERGLARITWTFDPLVRRNAHFNLVKLGARPEAYLTEFYGAMADAINEGDASDRLLAVWRVTGGQEEKACPEEAYTLVREADDGRPVIGTPAGAGCCSWGRRATWRGCGGRTPGRRWRGGWRCATRSAGPWRPGRVWRDSRNEANTWW